MPISQFIRRASLFVNGITNPEHWGQHPPDLVSDVSNIQPFNRLFNSIENNNAWSKKGDEDWNGYHLAKSQQSSRVEQFLRKYKQSILKLDELTNHDRSLVNFIDSIKSKFPVWNIAVSSPDTGQDYITPGTGVKIHLSERTPNSRGFIQQIYSNYAKSVTCDLDEGESRSLPLLLIYLVKTSTRYPDGGHCYQQRKTPSVQIGMILPPVHTGGMVIDFMANNTFEYDTQPLHYTEDGAIE